MDPEQSVVKRKKIGLVLMEIFSAEIFKIPYSYESYSWLLFIYTPSGVEMLCN